MMFEGTHANAYDLKYDGRLPSNFSFPLIFDLEEKEHPVVKNIDSTISAVEPEKDKYTSLYDEIRSAFLFARHNFRDLDEDLLKAAFLEAKLLASSPLFGSELYPNISVDPYGEFTFSHRSSAGYIDIGVRGEGELSYHVRNDIDPQATAFDDYDWVDYHVPQQLFAALKKIRHYL